MNDTVLKCDNYIQNLTSIFKTENRFAIDHFIYRNRKNFIVVKTGYKRDWNRLDNYKQ